MITAIVSAIVAAAAAGAVGFGASLRTVKQYERGIVFRFGKVLDSVRQPGLTRIIPGVDRMRTVNMQVVTMPVPAQEGITRDNVTVRVDAVVYFRVVDPARALIYVQDYKYAVSLVAQTSLRSIIGKSLLDDLLSNREPLNQGMELMLETPATGWGVEIDRVEIKDVALPESMKRSMARQAEADRERRARIITADGEFQASSKLADAARIMSETPSALQLRLLQTIVEVAAEKNSTLVLPFPVELLRFLESAGGGAPTQALKAAQKAVDALTTDKAEAVETASETIAIEGGEADAAAAPTADKIPEASPLPDLAPAADAIARPLTEPLIEAPHWRDAAEPSDDSDTSKPSDS
ncbi:band 7 protein [Catenulispora acidiphila DSM 44928]|uniref:Band 7 protein n=1 Tax=Catenulispora acidiphila (strain DSM 44928 / JCM 14897 / NBRC 102108 / NRRL B-24433 / ID139908) TaxID=479433 RepID=C7QJC4_CATAD|nr:slipin family protein [Catenulispora acidiphila]ACU71147.1 band 7 protein [Catenulispora acidiphila DSM 44928]